MPFSFALVTLLLSASATAAAPCEIVPNFSVAVAREVGPVRAQGQVSFLMAAIDGRTGETLCEDGVAPERVIYPASAIKTLVAVAVLRKVDSGDLALLQPVTVDQPNAPEECDASGCWDYADGRRSDVSRLLSAMIRRSSNVATNQLVDLASKAWINSTADAAGAPALRVHRKLYVTIDPEPGIAERNAATAIALGELYRELATGRLGLLSVESRALLVEMLGSTRHNNRLNARFPPGISFFHKTGSTSRTSADAGFYRVGDDRVVIIAGLQAFRDFGSLVRIGEAAYGLMPDDAP